MGSQIPSGLTESSASLPVYICFKTSRIFSFNQKIEYQKMTTNNGQNYQKKHPRLMSPAITGPATTIQETWHLFCSTSSAVHRGDPEISGQESEMEGELSKNLSDLLIWGWGGVWPHSAVLREPYSMLEIEPRLAVCEANALPDVLLFLPFKCLLLF